MEKRFSHNQTRINEQIQANELRLIGNNGEQIGIVKRFKALEIAQAEGLDLVEIAPHAKPPVAKIMDYGKRQYNKKKQERKSRAKSKKKEAKGVRLGIKTDTHDIDVKKKRTLKFLKKNYKVCIEIVLKGREKMFLPKAREILENFIKNLETPIKFDQEIQKSPYGFNAVIKKDSSSIK